MVARAKYVRSLDEARKHVAEAKRLAERHDVHNANPAEYMPPAPDQDAWDALLNRIK